MATFRFPLEKVLTVREYESKLAQQACATAQMALVRAQTALEQAQLARSSFAAEWHGRKAKRTSVRDMVKAIEHYDRLVNAEHEVAMEVHRALADVAAKRGLLEAAERRTKALQELKDRQWEAHQYGELAADQSAIDEMASAMLQRRTGAKMP